MKTYFHLLAAFGHTAFIALLVWHAATDNYDTSNLLVLGLITILFYLQAIYEQGKERKP